MEIFKNQNWTRVISHDLYQPDDPKSWPIAPDLTDEYDALFTIDEDSFPEIEPAYDPAVFERDNPYTPIGAWRIPDNELEELALKASRIRQRFTEKPEKQKNDEKLMLNSKDN